MLELLLELAILVALPELFLLSLSTRPFYRLDSGQQFATNHIVRVWCSKPGLSDFEIQSFSIIVTQGYVIQTFRATERVGSKVLKEI